MALWKNCYYDKYVIQLHSFSRRIFRLSHISTDFCRTDWYNICNIIISLNISFYSLSLFFLNLPTIYLRSILKQATKNKGVISRKEVVVDRRIVQLLFTHLSSHRSLLRDHSNIWLICQQFDCPKGSNALLSNERSNN
uniref:Uncharacterized protein n=1 Tax=Heterorhabditis bacteriophora TaxID=37862 RepID=A0A1I7W859_HETBA